MVRTFLVAALALLSFGALAADRPAAEACAASLAPDAKLIYQAVAPSVTAASDLRNLIQERTRALVSNGQVVRGSARSNAVAASTCLQDLR